MGSLCKLQTAQARRLGSGVVCHYFPYVGNTRTEQKGLQAGASLPIVETRVRNGSTGGGGN